MPASPEFVLLCQSQIAALTQGLGAALSVVYLTDDPTAGGDADLTPVAAYPEEAVDWSQEQILRLLSGGPSGTPLPPRRLLADAERSPAYLPNPASTPRQSDRPPETPDPTSQSAAEPAAEPGLYSQKIVLPLVYEGMMMGLLVTACSDCLWGEQEQSQVEHIAQTLAIARLLDQRSQWAEFELHQRQVLQSQQRDQMDDLLHQFRNPLTAVRTFGKLLLRRVQPEDENRTVAEGIVRESDRLQDLLRQFDTLIDLDPASLPEASPASPPRDAEVRSGGSPPLALPSQAVPTSLEPRSVTGQMQIEALDLAAVVAPLVSSASAIAQERGLTLQTELPPDLPFVRGDRRALQEVLNNLLDNALKYTPSGGIVRLIGGIERELDGQTQQAIAILDTGPGIPKADFEHLFERHFRGVQSQGEIPGTGLGLAIARDLISQMQGEIQVFSPADESGLIEPSTLPGTAFLVWLPIHVASQD
ncbi:HAMP domain-containing sensor histidine kinase [Thermoleptolyngbya sp. C42_A2020_037]|uniref:sensor histidine kinase n=1 Tax=Thermoleptolyngbya sp. C42_A2020_037 TaxID=2747799 RepID=UPI0025D85EFA|nr:HAMP domain-containing sensor histidine kinase [Thermoleptolyngbya sp. C42_A2020_037]